MSTQEGIPNPFICDCEEGMRYACGGEGFYKKKEGKRYCVLHYPGDEKAADFKTALDKKQSVKDYNFNGVWFPKGVRFKELHLDGRANFSSATFNEDIDFSDVKFSGEALFNKASFNAGVDFSRANFTADADFFMARFSNDARFRKASFSEDADFRDASFSRMADFFSAKFSGRAFFMASFSGDADFITATFSSDADFRNADFSASAHFEFVSFSAAAIFDSAKFSGYADFKSASFNSVADFNEAMFSGNANYSSASFDKDAYFRFAKFNKDAYFRSASFSETANFNAAFFSADADFNAAAFKDYVYFSGNPKRREFGDQTQLNFQFTRFEKPDRVSFHTINLKPHWFVNVDSRKFEFTDAVFDYDLNDELERMIKPVRGAPHRLLSIACRQLADNAETNHRYHEASRLRYSSFNARRVERFYGLVFWRLDWWYWLASGYSESVSRAFIVFVMLIGLFAVGYKYSDFEHVAKTEITPTAQAAEKSSPDTPNKDPKRFTWDEAARYSINVSILQKPDPKPQSSFAKWLVIIETVLGPAQAALLALALRRKFMR